MEKLIEVLSNPTVLAAIIGAIGVIIAAIIGIKKKDDDKKKTDPPVIVIPSSGKHNGIEDHSEGIVNGIEIVGTANMDKMPINSAEYLQALAAQGEMLKNRDTVFDVLKEES